MPGTVTHSHVSGFTDDTTDAAAGRLLPSHWNAGHTVTLNVATAEIQDAAVTAAKLAPGVGGSPLSHAFVCLERAVDSGLGGGQGTGNAWATRPLNQEVYDPDNIVTLASNQFTLIAGTYIIEWSGYAHSTAGRHSTRLFDVTANLPVRNGVTCDNATPSMGTAKVTITSANVYRIEHWMNTSRGDSFDFGETSANPGNPGDEVHTPVKITKIG